MCLRKEIEKNKIAISSLEDDSLVQLFKELNINQLNDKELIKSIIKTLLDRKKVELITMRGLMR